MKIAFLGAGKMAEAILAALLRNKIVAPADVLACEKVAERRAFIRRRYRVAVNASARETISASDVIFVAVKPQDLDALLAEAAPALTPRKLVISIAAGKTLRHLQRLTGAQTRLVRVMPNLAVMVGAGMSVFCLGRRATPADRRLAGRLLGCCGRVMELPEKHFDAVTALSGSGPAFFAYLMLALADGARAEGLPDAAARLLAEQTMLGAARYLLENDADPQTFIQAVTSPKGTTAAGMAVLEASDARAVLARAIQAAARRGAELCA